MESKGTTFRRLLAEEEKLRAGSFQDARRADKSLPEVPTVRSSACIFRQ